MMILLQVGDPPPKREYDASGGITYMHSTVGMFSIGARTRCSRFRTRVKNCHVVVRCLLGTASG